MAHLWCSHFLGIRAKLEKPKYSLFLVARKINDKVYVLQLPHDQNISHTFNVADLFEYHLDDEESSSFPSDGVLCRMDVYYKWGTFSKA